MGTDGLPGKPGVWRRLVSNRFRQSGRRLRTEGATHRRFPNNRLSRLRCTSHRRRRDKNAAHQLGGFASAEFHAGVECHQHDSGAGWLDRHEAFHHRVEWIPVGSSLVPQWTAEGIDRELCTLQHSRAGQRRQHLDASCDYRGGDRLLQPNGGSHWRRRNENAAVGSASKVGT